MDQDLPCTWNARRKHPRNLSIGGLGPLASSIKSSLRKPRFPKVENFHSGKLPMIQGSSRVRWAPVLNTYSSFFEKICLDFLWTLLQWSYQSKIQSSTFKRADCLKFLTPDTRIHLKHLRGYAIQNAAQREKIWKAVTPQCTKMVSSLAFCEALQPIGQRSKSKTDSTLSCGTPLGQVSFSFVWRAEPCCRRGQEAWFSHRMDEKRDFKSLSSSQRKRVRLRRSKHRSSYDINKQQEGRENAGKQGNSLKWRLPFRVFCLVQNNTPPGVLKQAPKERRIPIPTMVLWWAAISFFGASTFSCHSSGLHHLIAFADKEPLLQGLMFLCV